MERSKMKYRVNYYFDGKGSAIVEADNIEEARDKFYEGETLDDQDNSENYVVDEVFEDGNDVISDKDVVRDENGDEVEV